MAKNDNSPAIEEVVSDANEVAPSAPLATYHSESATYVAVMDALQGDPRVTALPAANVFAIMQKIAESAPDLAVALAGVGGTTANAVDLDTIAAISDEPFVVSTIGKRGIQCDDGKTRNGIIGLAIYPHYTADVFLESAEGAAYIQKLLDKETGHVSFRGLRPEDEGEGFDWLVAAAQAMPVSVNDFLNRDRASGAGSAFAVFNDNWAAFRQSMARSAKNKPIVALLPAKADVLKAIRSKAFADTLPTNLEARGMFVTIGKTLAAMIQKLQDNAAEAGKESPVKGDPQAILAWLAGRDELDLRPAEGSIADDADLDLSGMGFGDE